MRSKEIVNAHVVQIHPTGLDKIRRAVEDARAALRAANNKHSDDLVKKLNVASDQFIEGWRRRYFDRANYHICIERKLSRKERTRALEAFDVAVRYPHPKVEKSMAQVIHETREAIAISNNRPDVWWRHHKDEL